MHREVYQHSLKRQMESIIKKDISKRGRAISKKNNYLFVMRVWRNFCLEKKISLKEYLGMDDTILMYHMIRWQDEEDTILKKLCYSFFDCRKFTKNKIKKSIGNKGFLKETINIILQEYGKEEILDFEKQYFYLKI